MASNRLKYALQAGASAVVLLAHPVFAQGAAAAPPPAAPAPAPAAQPQEPPIQDVVVNARRIDERLQDVPISISVFSQQQLTNRNVVNSQDLALYTPSLSSNSNFGQESATYAIRGFVQDSGTAPSVGVYFADVVALRGPTQGTQAGDGAGPGNFFDLQNVQVLKGPQGTLQGVNTTGGAVLFVPQKPTGRTEGNIELSLGNYDMHRVQAMYNSTIGDKIRFRVALDHMDRDGWLKNISGIGPKDFNDVNYTAVRASMVVDITNNLENYTIASFSNSSTNGSVQKMIGCENTGANATGFTDPAFNPGNFLGILSCGQLAREKAQGAGFYDVEQALPNPTSQLQQWQIINTTTWHATDNLTVKNIASYGELTYKQRSPLFGTDFRASDLPPLYQELFFRGVPPIFTDINATPDTADQYTFTEELQLQGDALDNRLTYQGGLYFETSGPDGTSGSESNQILACSNIATMSCSDLIGQAFGANVGALNVTSGRETFHDVGYYGQASYKITHQLKLTVGARYTTDVQTDSSTRYYYSFPVTPPYTQAPTKNCTDPSQAPTCSEFLRQKSEKPTWLIDLDYKPVEDTLLYAKYARGYRAGGVFPNGPTDHRTFAPEQVDSYEGGLKETFHGPMPGTFDITGFYNDFSNQQLQLGFNTNPDYMGTGFPAPVSPTTGIVNAGKSTIWGIEVASTLNPFPGFSLDGSYTYLDARIDKIAPFSTVDPNYVASQSSIAPGSPLALSPRNKFTLTATYVLPIDRSIGKVAASATITHTDKQLTNYVYQTPAAVALFGANFGYVGATDLLNLNLSWTGVYGKPFDISLFGSNVTGEHYYSFIAGLGGLTGAGNEFGVVGEPRMFGVRLKYHFGS